MSDSTKPDRYRELIRSERIFKVVEVMERRRRFHYEVSDGTRTWIYPLKWSAFLKFDRLVAKQGGVPSHE
jgi:hypothetical protein